MWAGQVRPPRALPRKPSHSGGTLAKPKPGQVHDESPLPQPREDDGLRPSGCCSRMRPFRLNTLLMGEDFPTLERPMTATSGRRAEGNCDGAWHTRSTCKSGIRTPKITPPQIISPQRTQRAQRKRKRLAKKSNCSVVAACPSEGFLRELCVLCGESSFFSLSFSANSARSAVNRFLSSILPAGRWRRRTPRSR